MAIMDYTGHLIIEFITKSKISMVGEIEIQLGSQSSRFELRSMGSGNSYMLSSKVIEEWSADDQELLSGGLVMTSLWEDMGVVLRHPKTGVETSARVISPEGEPPEAFIEVECDIKFGSFRSALENASQHFTKYDGRLINAAGLYNSFHHLPKTDVAARFIIIVSAIESVFQKKASSDDVCSLVCNFVQMAEDQLGDIPEKNSILGRIRELKNKSISLNIREEIDKNLPDFKSGDDQSGSDLFREAYKLRSEFVHDGKRKVESMTRLFPDLRLLCWSLIREKAGVDHQSIRD